MNSMAWDHIGPSCITDKELDEIRLTLRFGQNFVIRRPDPEEDLHDLGDKKMVFFSQHVACGLRLPPPPFIRDICNRFKISPSQLHPSAFRRALVFHILVYRNGFTDTAGLFYATQILKRVGKHYYSFSSYNNIGMKFLEIPPSLDGRFFKKTFIVELERGTIRSVFGLRYPSLHAKKWEFHKPTPELPRHVRILFRDLRDLTRGDLPNMKAITDCDSALADCGLWPHFPEPEIDASWDKKLDIPALMFSDDEEEEIPNEGQGVPSGEEQEILGGNVPNPGADGGDEDLGPERENRSGGQGDKPPHSEAFGTGDEDDIFLDLDDPLLQNILGSGDVSHDVSRTKIVQGGRTPLRSALVSPKAARMNATDSQAESSAVGAQKRKLASLSKGGEDSSSKHDEGISRKRKRQVSLKEAECVRSPGPASSRDRKDKGVATEAEPSPAFLIEAQTEGDDGMPRTLTLLQSLTSFSRSDYLALCEGLCGPVETAHFKKKNTYDKMAALAASTVINTVRVGSLLQDMRVEVDRAKEDKKRIKELETILKQSNKNSQIVSKRAADLEAKVKILEGEKVEAERARVEAEASMVARAEELVRSEAILAQERADLEGRKGDFLAQVQDKVLSLISEREKIAEEQGMKKFRSGYLKSAEGQEFLRILHRDVLAGFLKTGEFMEAAQKGIGFLIADVAKATLRLVGASKEQQKKADMGALKAKLNLAGLGKAMGVDPDAGGDWWISTMDKAGALLAQVGDPISDFPSVELYPLPCFAQSSPPAEAQSEEEGVRTALAQIFGGKPGVTETTREDTRSGEA